MKCRSPASISDGPDRSAVSSSPPRRDCAVAALFSRCSATVSMVATHAPDSDVLSQLRRIHVSAPVEGSLELFPGLLARSSQSEPNGPARGPTRFTVLAHSLCSQALSESTRNAAFSNHPWDFHGEHGFTFAADLKICRQSWLPFNNGISWLTYCVRVPDDTSHSTLIRRCHT